jgi:hypothetical protein
MDYGRKMMPRSIGLTVSQDSVLLATAARLGCSASEVVRRALAEYPPIAQLQAEAASNQERLLERAS